jgi:hypothetical protein
VSKGAGWLGPVGRPAVSRCSFFEFSFLFFFFSNKIAQTNAFLSILKTFSRHGPKTKVVALKRGTFHVQELKSNSA